MKLPGCRKWGLAPSMTDMAVVIRGRHWGTVQKRGQAPSRQRFFAALTSVAARSQSPFSTPRLQFELGVTGVPRCSKALWQRALR